MGIAHRLSGSVVPLSTLSINGVKPSDHDSDTEQDADLETEDQEGDSQHFVGKDGAKWAKKSLRSKFARTPTRNLVKVKHMAVVVFACNHNL
ncbi:hypothetical protein QE152_g13648 [Popillia japonica]|uniref:Uncharacterized protein n=1 Tax=Popillia japonica TaxID=7064 RepID=A0AAW1L904_POPJA